MSFLKGRWMLVDTCELGSQKHLIHGLLQVDVTDARHLLRQSRDETGQSLSFTGFMIACVAKAVDENKMMHAYRDALDRLALFDDVDITTIVEIDAGDHSVPLGHTIRAANKRSLFDIQRSAACKPEARPKSIRYRTVRVDHSCCLCRPV